MVILYLPPSKRLQRQNYPGFCPRLSQDVSSYAKANAQGWVGGKRVASVQIESFQKWPRPKKELDSPPGQSCCVRCCAQDSYLLKISSYLLQLLLPAFAFETQRIRIARLGPARENQILPDRDKCGAQKRAVHGLPFRLCGATFDSSGPIYALASTHNFVICLTCSHALSTCRCHYIESVSNRTPSHLVNVRRF